MSPMTDDVEGGEEEPPRCSVRLCERVATVGHRDGDICAWCARGLASKNRRLEGRI